MQDAPDIAGFVILVIVLARVTVRVIGDGGWVCILVVENRCTSLDGRRDLIIVVVVVNG